MRHEYDFGSAKRGPIKEVPPNKMRITIRLDSEVIDWFKNQVHLAGGGNYQTLINHALSEYIASHTDPNRESLEALFRRVLREELEERISNSPES